MPYRVELASTGRAGCQDAACKKDQVKIEKGVLRCGSWVETDHFSGWRWKHWGCVSGKQLENIRKSIENPIHEGQYDWDMMDGLQGEDKKDRLPPDDQEKVKRCITQGFIDPEDWNGDPECNVLGKTGIHLTQKQKERKEADNAAEAEDENGDSPNKSKKRSRGKKADAEESEDDAKPAKKKGKKAAKKEESADEKPAKSRAKKSVKEEDAESDEIIPAKNQRGKKATVKEESDNEVEKKAVSTKKRGKKAAVKEEVSDDEVMPVKKQRGKKAAVKEETSDDEVMPVKKQRGKKAAVKEETSDDEVMPVKKQRGKKAGAKEEASDDEAIPVKKQRGKKDIAKKEDASTLIPGISNADLYAEFRSKLDDDDPDDDYDNYVRIRKEFPDVKSMGAAMQQFFTFKYGADIEKDPELIAKVGKIGKIFEEFLKLQSGYGSYEKMRKGMLAQEKTGEKTKQNGRKIKVKDEPVEETSIAEEAPKSAKRARRSSKK